MSHSLHNPSEVSLAQLEDTSDNDEFHQDEFIGYRHMTSRDHSYNLPHIDHNTLSQQSFNVNNTSSSSPSVGPNAGNLSSLAFINVPNVIVNPSTKSPQPATLITSPPTNDQIIAQDDVPPPEGTKVFDTEEEFLHAGYGGRTALQQSNIRSILKSSSEQTTKFIYDVNASQQNQKPLTPTELAVLELKQGILALNAGLKKPIPTFTRIHLNTNWIIAHPSHTNTRADNNAVNGDLPIDPSHHQNNTDLELTQHQIVSPVPMGGTQPQKKPKYHTSNAMYKMSASNDPLLATLANYNQKRVTTVDDSTDPEKRSVALSFLNCLKLRKEFLFTPAVVDRRRYNIMDQPPPYEPALNTVARPLFDSLATTTETTTTTQVFTTPQAPRPSDSPAHLDIIAMHSSASPSFSRPSTATITQTIVKETNAFPASPRALELAPSTPTTLSTTTTTPTHHPPPSSPQHITHTNTNPSPLQTERSLSQRSSQPVVHNVLTTTTTTSTTTRISALLGLLDTNLSGDLINNPHNYIYGFVNGVMHFYKKDAMPIIEYERQRKYHKTQERLADSNGIYHGRSHSTSSFSGRDLSVERKMEPVTLPPKRPVDIALEETYTGYIVDAYHIALHQHRVYAEHTNKQNYINSSVGNTNNTSDEYDIHNLPTDAIFRQYNPALNNLFPIPSWADFCDSMAYVVNLCSYGPAKTWAHARLTMLETQKKLHNQLNDDLELAQTKYAQHRDFYNVRKVDNHVHHSAAMSQKHLLRFMKKKMREPQAATRPVITRNGQKLTLNQVFESLNLTAYDLSIDKLDCHASQTVFQRFDKFNQKYSPIGESRLREIFLKYNNEIKGEYLSEITKEIFQDLENSKYCFAEYRVSIYGRSLDEWNALADWIVDNKLISKNVRWMIQIPRIYSAYRRDGVINSFADMLRNIFLPLFHVTLHPESNPKLHSLLNLIVGFDTVDDESNSNTFYWHTTPAPHMITGEDDPHYLVFLYYLYANLRVLNELRQLTGQHCWALRPHAGESGNNELNIAGAFLLANAINHGIKLFNFPPVQYLYYLGQIPISVSPLSNNLLFLEYQKNPFKRFFDRGLNVTLSTDDPLMLSMTKEPLIEEYCVAAQIWKLSHIDLCEIARNSVLHSGFSHQEKTHWLGNSYWLKNVDGNDIRCTNVPDIRVQFRWEVLYQEHALLTHLISQDTVDPTLIDPIY